MYAHSLCCVLETKRKQNYYNQYHELNKYNANYNIYDKRKSLRGFSEVLKLKV